MVFHSIGTPGNVLSSVRRKERFSEGTYVEKLWLMDPLDLSRQVCAYKHCSCCLILFHCIRGGINILCFAGMMLQ